MGSKRVYKLQKDEEDLRDLHFCSAIKKSSQLPPKVDLKGICSPIVDQLSLGSCTANAIASGLRELLLIKNKQNLVRLSRLFLYYEERLMEGTVSQDSGAQIRDGMKVLQKMGVCPESEDPYNIATFKIPPSAKEIYDAAQFKINSYNRITNLNQLKASIAAQLPVVIGIKVYTSFESQAVAKSGIIPMPKKGETLLGGHAILVVGYDDSKSWLIVRNSWGTKWGDHGYFYLPYAVFNKIWMDAWTGTV